VIATNAGLIGVSRLTYSLGQHRQLPPILGRVHPRRMTPYVSIIVFGGIACLLIIPGSTGLLADLYVFGSMISFTAAHLSLITLRIREPDMERPWVTPFNIRVRGRLLPLTAIFGAVGTFGVWLVIVYYQDTSRLIAFAWIAIGLVMYVVYRKAKGYSLTATVAKVVMPETMKADVDYDEILVPIVGSRITDEMMVLACQLATEKKSAINGLFVIEVPLNLPLDARLVVERARADRTLAAAAFIAKQFKVKFTPVVITARSAGRAIVEEAERQRSDVIIMGTMRKRRIADRVFGRTTDYVVDHAPCEVLLNIVPKGYPSEGSGEFSDDSNPTPPASSHHAARGNDSAGGSSATQ